MSDDPIRRRALWNVQSAMMRGSPSWVVEECSRLHRRQRIQRITGQFRRRFLGARRLWHAIDAVRVYHRDTPTGV